MRPPTSPPEPTRFRLSRPVDDDVPELFEICADLRLWAHYPSLRHRDVDQTRAMVTAWSESWDEIGLGVWTVRLGTQDRVIGYGGCALLGGSVWNLSYRLAVDQHGRGYATELARFATTMAAAHDPDRPVVAYLMEHNLASDRVARKVGLTLIDRGPDAGNPDPEGVRLIYADRPLTEDQLALLRR